MPQGGISAAPAIIPGENRMKTGRICHLAHDKLFLSLSIFFTQPIVFKSNIRNFKKAAGTGKIKIYSLKT